jgi:molybdopterin-biosynthesis enzyme MoeA-like protein
MAKGKMSEQEKKWETEDDIRALSRAEEVEAELKKDPERRKRLNEMVKARMSEMAGLLKEKD